MTENTEMLALEIYMLMKQRPGAFSFVSGLLERNDSTKISRQLNPNDDRRDNPFVEVDQILTALLAFSPEIEEQVWGCLEQRRLHRLPAVSTRKRDIPDLIAKILPELGDVIRCSGQGAPRPEVEKEVYELLKVVEALYERVKCED